MRDVDSKIEEIESKIALPSLQPSPSTPDLPSPSSFLPYPPTRIFSSKTYRHGFFSASVIYQSRSFSLLRLFHSIHANSDEDLGKETATGKEGWGEKGASVPPFFSFFVFPLYPLSERKNVPFAEDEKILESYVRE